MCRSTVVKAIVVDRHQIDLSHLKRFGTNALTVISPQSRDLFDINVDGGEDAKNLVDKISFDMFQLYDRRS
jgi:hypothetical protein